MTGNPIRFADERLQSTLRLRWRGTVAAMLAVFLTSGLALSANGQFPHNTDVLVCRLGAGVVGDLLRLTPSGTVTTIVPGAKFGALYPNNVEMHPNNVNAVVLETALNGPHLMRVWDVFNGQPLGTLATFATTPNWVDHGNGGSFVVFGRDIWEVGPNGGLTTLVAGFGVLRAMQCGVHDLQTGGYIAVEGWNVRRIAPDGTIARTDRLPAPCSSIDQDHRTGDVYAGDGAGGRVYRVDPLGAVQTVQTPTLSNTNAMTFDRGAGVGEIVLGSDPVYRIDVNGGVHTMHAGFKGLANTGMCFDQNRNLVVMKTGSKNRYRIDVHNPALGAGGDGYLIALSATGFRTGIPIPGAGVVQLDFDGVVALTIQGLFPLLTNNIGTLDAFGRASATLDLGGLSVPLTDKPFWTVVVTWRGSAITMISKPVVTTLE